MITREQKIEEIYKKFSRKDLSFWCKVFHKVDDKKWFEWKIIISETKTFNSNFYWILVKNKSEVSWLQIREMEIIGHPVMIWDVMDYFDYQTRFSMASLYNIIHDDFADIMNKWEEKENPSKTKAMNVLTFYLI